MKGEGRISNVAIKSEPFARKALMEARVGMEPTHKAFAEPCLTTWLPRRLGDTKIKGLRLRRKLKVQSSESKTWCSGAGVSPVRGSRPRRNNRGETPSDRRDACPTTAFG